MRISRRPPAWVLRGARGQLAYLVRHHGEATAGFTGAGGLDGGIERQQVGLGSDALDGADDLGHLLQVLFHGAVLVFLVAAQGFLLVQGMDIGQRAHHPQRRAIGVRRV